MRPIDADALLKWLSEWELQEAPWWGANGYGDAKVAETIKEAIDAVEQMPTIDAVPVIRCKDCKHWGMHKSLNVPWCFEMHIDKSEDGYCDSGERSEE